MGCPLMLVVWCVTETRSETGTPTLSAALSAVGFWGAPGRPCWRPPGAAGRWATAVPATSNVAATLSISGRTGMATTPVGRSDWWDQLDSAPGGAIVENSYGLTIHSA